MRTIFSGYFSGHFHRVICGHLAQAPTIKQMLKHIINSTLALEAWGLLGIFAAIIAGKLALLLKVYLSILSYGDESWLNTIQDKRQHFNNMFLCSFTVVCTVIALYLF